MPHDDLFDHGTPSEGFADHTHEENAGASHTEGLSAIPTVGSAGIVPMAEPLAVDTGGGAPGGTVALTPNPEGPGTTLISAPRGYMAASLGTKRRSTPRASASCRSRGRSRG